MRRYDDGGNIGGMNQGSQLVMGPYGYNYSKLKRKNKKRKPGYLQYDTGGPLGDIASAIPLVGGFVKGGIDLVSSYINQNKQDEIEDKKRREEQFNADVKNRLSNTAQSPTYMPVAKQGGFTVYKGETHEGPNGGILTDEQGNPTGLSNNKPIALTEKNEVSRFNPYTGSTYVYSDSLGFARPAANLVHKYKLDKSRSLYKYDPLLQTAVDKQFDNLQTAQEFAKGSKTSADEAIGMFKNGGSLTSDKAKEILRDGTAQGHPLTAKQKRYFGWIAGGSKAKGGEIWGGPTDYRSLINSFYMGGSYPAGLTLNQKEEFNLSDHNYNNPRGYAEGGHVDIPYGYGGGPLRAFEFGEGGDVHDKPGGSNVGRKTFANGQKRTGPYVGPSGGAPKGSYPVPDIKHARAALALAHHAPNPAGIRAAVIRKYPQLKKEYGGFLKAVLKDDKSIFPTYQWGGPEENNEVGRSNMPSDYYGAPDTYPYAGPTEAANVSPESYYQPGVHTTPWMDAYARNFNNISGFLDRAGRKFSNAMPNNPAMNAPTVSGIPGQGSWGKFTPTSRTTSATSTNPDVTAGPLTMLGALGRAGGKGTARKVNPLVGELDPTLNRGLDIYAGSNRNRPGEVLAGAPATAKAGATNPSTGRMLSPLGNILSAVGSVADYASMRRARPTNLTLPRMTAERISLANQRLANERNAAIARSTNVASSRGMGLNAGQTYANTTAANTGVNRLLGQQNLESLMNEENTNAQLRQQASSINAELGAQEATESNRMQNAYRMRMAAANPLGNLSRNAANYFASNAAYQEQNNMMRMLAPNFEPYNQPGSNWLSRLFGQQPGFRPRQ